MRDRPGAGGAEYAMFAMRGTSGVVVVRSLQGPTAGGGVRHEVPMHGVRDGIRGHRVRWPGVREHGLRRHGVQDDGVCVGRLAVSEHLGGKAVPADLHRERPVAGRHEPRRNDGTRCKRDQHDAGHERSPATLGRAQAHIPWGYSWRVNFTPKGQQRGPSRAPVNEIGDASGPSRSGGAVTACPRTSWLPRGIYGRQIWALALERDVRRACDGILPLPQKPKSVSYVPGMICNL